MAAQTQAEWFAGTEIGKAVGELYKEIEWLQETNRDLLDALQEVIVGPGGFPADINEFDLAQANAAIQKATGRE